MTTATAPPKQAYFSINDMEDTVCVMAMVQRIQSWQLFQAVLPQLEDDVDCTLAVLSKKARSFAMAGIKCNPSPLSDARTAAYYRSANGTLDFGPSTAPSH